MRSFTLVIVGLGVSLLAAQAQASECGSDKDCKGNRVCYLGRCVNPETADRLEAAELERSETLKETEETPAPPVVDDVVAENSEGIEEAEAALPPEPEKLVIEAKKETSEQTTDRKLASNKELGPNQAKLLVWLDDRYSDLKGVKVFVDGEEVGEASWEGIVSAGVHSVRLEGAGYFSYEKETKVWPRRTRIMQPRLLPINGFKVGHFYVGALFGFGLGTLFNDERTRPGAGGGGLARERSSVSSLMQKRSGGKSAQ